MYKWEINSKYSFGTKNFARIYRFFVIETPLKQVSQRGISFEERNIDTNELRNMIKNIAPSLKKNWKVEIQKKIKDMLEEYNILNEVAIPFEVAIHTKKTNYVKAEALFYSIRCALAHGGFNIYLYKKEKYYFLENREDKDLKGRIILKEKTLLKIIDYCENKIS